MVRKSSLREFQAYLATRLAGIDDRRPAGLLGFQSGGECWLIALPDSGEVIPLPPLTGVPMTRPWFAGIANVRGSLHAVSDFSAFRQKEATPRNASSRLLLIGTRHGNNVALLVARILGLRNIDDLTPAESDPQAPPWASDAYMDREGQRWRMLDVRPLFSDDTFMNIGV
ncbi:MAG: chemotaxis protein CheW [Candidatus Accumulibacter sp.]|jgi:twitching motility protein PilI|nr:chemotaxis protein CheW [Accumulibacter sp.]